MESLRKIGQVCREHYEKLILSFTLLIFAGAVFYLYQDSSRQRQAPTRLPYSRQL